MYQLKCIVPGLRLSTDLLLLVSGGIWSLIAVDARAILTDVSVRLRSSKIVMSCKLSRKDEI